MTGNTETASAKELTAESASRMDDGIFRRSRALAEEIAAFLENHGTPCKITFRERFPLIVSEKGKVILPLGICAESQERAAVIRETAEIIPNHRIFLQCGQNILVYHKSFL